MGDFAVTRIHHGTLVANVVDTITFAHNYRQVEVLNRSGSAEIFVRVDGEIPAVGAAESEILLALPGSLLIDSPGSGPTVVKLISSGVPTYSVVAMNRGPR